MSFLINIGLLIYNTVNLKLSAHMNYGTSTNPGHR